MENIAKIGKMSLNQDPEKVIKEKKIDDERDFEMTAAEMIAEINDMEEECENKQVKLARSRWACRQLEEQLEEQKKDMEELEELSNSDVTDVADSKTEALLLRESIKKLARENKELSKAEDTLEEDIDDQKQRYDDVRSLVVTLTREKFDWTETKKLCKRIAGGDNSEFDKKKRKFMEQMKGIVFEDKMDEMKDFERDLNELLEIQKEDFERSMARKQKEQNAKQRTNELKTKCGALETRRNVLAEINTERNNLPDLPES